MSTLLDVLLPPDDAGGRRVAGVLTGVVTNNQDPEKLGRVKVKFPSVSDTEESAWARVAAPMAGAERGMWTLPEVDDEVLVAFDRGDTRFPYVLGGLWNRNAPPPETNEDGKNAVRMLRSRSGHVVRLDDADGAEKIEIVDGSGKNSIVISTADGTITLKCDGNLAIEAGGSVTLKGASVELG